MGKKAKLYLIIVINLLAWGYVGYKVYGALQGEEDVPFTNDQNQIKKITETEKEEKSFLALNYADPFLKNGNFSKAHNNPSGLKTATHAGTQKPAAPVIIKPAVAPAVTQPAITIRYLGALRNTDKGTQTAMITVDGRSVFVKEADIVEGYTILEISKESIKVKKGKEILTIGK